MITSIITLDDQLLRGHDPRPPTLHAFVCHMHACCAVGSVNCHAAARACVPGHDARSAIAAAREREGADSDSVRIFTPG